jgi:DNA-binding FrmR family transcriptional regulator
VKHASHPAIAARLKRVEGHLRSVILMLDDGRDCLSLAQQLHAVERAVANAKRELIQDHIEHCLDDAVREGTMDARTALGEFKALTKYL